MSEKLSGREQKCLEHVKQAQELRDASAHHADGNGTGYDPYLHTITKATGYAYTCKQSSVRKRAPALALSPDPLNLRLYALLINCGIS
jgi:hypothetical protein